MSRTKRFLTGFVFVLGLGLAFFAGWVRLPYYSLGPGPAREVQPLISVSGAQEYPVAGQAHHDDGQLPRSECGGDAGRVARSAPGGGLPGDAVSGGGDGRAGGAAVALADGPEQDRRHRRGAAAADRLPEGSRRRGAPGVRVSGMSRRGEALRRRSGRVDRRDAGAFGRRRLEGARCGSGEGPHHVRGDGGGRDAPRSRSHGSDASPTSTPPGSASTSSTRSRSTCASRAATWVAPPPG